MWSALRSCLSVYFDLSPRGMFLLLVALSESQAPLIALLLGDVAKVRPLRILVVLAGGIAVLVGIVLRRQVAARLVGLRTFPARPLIGGAGTSRTWCVAHVFLACDSESAQPSAFMVRAMLSSLSRSCPCSRISSRACF